MKAENIVSYKILEVNMSATAIIDGAVEVYFAFLVSQGIDPHCVEFDPAIQAIIDVSSFAGCCL